VFETEIDCRCNKGEGDASGGERGHHEQKDGIAEEIVRVGSDQEQAGEGEGGQEGEETGIPQPFGIETDDSGGAEAEGKSGHKSKGGKDAEGGKQEMSGVEEIGVHFER
jgi:hypothetical protein